MLIGHTLTLVFLEGRPIICSLHFIFRNLCSNCYVYNSTHFFLVHSNYTWWPFSNSTFWSCFSSPHPTSCSSSISFSDFWQILQRISTRESWAGEMGQPLKNSQTHSRENVRRDRLRMFPFITLLGSWHHLPVLITTIAHHLCLSGAIYSPKNV